MTVDHPYIVELDRFVTWAFRAVVASEAIRVASAVGIPAETALRSIEVADAQALSRALAANT